MFEIRARKRLPWKCELCASSSTRANPRVKKERKKKRETLLFTFLSVSCFYPYLPFSMMPFCVARMRSLEFCEFGAYVRDVSTRAFVSSLSHFLASRKLSFFVTRKAPFEKHQKKEATRRRKSASPSRSTHTQRENERENERERTRAEKEANRWWKDTT